MGLLDKVFKTNKNDTESAENIGALVSETAVDIIKKLSGSDVKRTKKVIDNVISITNASGGTGASTVLSNTAYMLSKRGFKVLVIDLNILYPSQYVGFGIKQKIETADLISFLAGSNTLGESIDTTTNISLLYANNRSLKDYIDAESDISVSNFVELIDKVRQLFDIVLMDVPMRLENLLINTAFYLSDQIYVVWDEGIASIANIERIRKNMAFSGIDAYNRMRAILNKRTSIKYDMSLFKKLKIDLAQVLPFDESIIDSSLRAVIFCDKGASLSKSANAFYKGIEDLSSTILKNGGYLG